MRKLLILAAAMMVVILCVPASALAQESAESTNHYGAVDLFSTYEPGEVMKDSFYFSDDWFTDDPAVVNDALALVSMQTVASVIDSDEDGAGAAMLKKMGFNSIEFYNFDTEDPDDCAFVRAEKALPSGGRLVAVVVQSYSMDSAMKKKGWTQNFVVNGDPIESEHYAFAKAAGKAYEILQEDLADVYTQYWVMGQSRGGAIANILATQLPPDHTYAYTFEAPATYEIPAAATDDGAEKEYAYIHNYLCADDPVPMIPPWGMTRYGQVHNIDLTLDIKAELRKLQSAMAEMYKEELKDGEVGELVDELLKVVETREDYTAPVVIPDGSGETNTYQDAMAHLMGAVFGGGFGGLQVEELMNHLSDLHEPLSALAKAIKERNAAELDQSEQDFWASANKLHDFLDILLPEGQENPLDEKDMFMALKLAGDVLIDENYVSETENNDEEVLGMILPLIELVGKKDALVYSHHFDTLIARLKVMSPAPKLEDFNVTMQKPAAGDSVDKAALELANTIDQSLSPEVSWVGEDAILQDNKTYNLKVVLHVPGRTVDGFAMTINGERPAQDLDVSYVNGEYIVTGTWIYALGMPAPVTIAFDAGEISENPDSITVDKGSVLGVAASGIIPDLGVVHLEGKAYKFEGWYLGETSWKDIVVNDDLMLTAAWKQVIDRVDISFKYPKVGEEPTMPTVPEGVDYYIGSMSISDDDYESMVIAERKQYSLYIYIESAGLPFLDEISSDDDTDRQYLGEVYVNGKQPDEVSYDYSASDKMGSLGVTCYFTPDYKETPDEEASGEQDSAEKALATKYLPLKLKSVIQTKKQIKLIWNKSSKASSYVVYGAPNRNKSMKKIATVKGNKYTVKKIEKKLKEGAFYKFYVAAKDASGSIVFKTKPIYVATKGEKKGNYKSVQIKVNNKVKKKVAVKKGRSLKIKAKGVKSSKKISIIKGVGIRYESSNTAIAKVSAKGVVKGVKKGTCTIYAYAPNGIAKTLKVVVK